MNEILLYKIQPKSFNISVIIAASHQLNKEEMIEAIKNECRINKYPEVFINKCIAGINVWGIPKAIKDMNRATFWADKNDDITNRKGYCAVQVLNCYGD